MIRLIQRGLMFGNLIEVASPALVERYNRALKSLIGKQTKLTDFHIDISGYSPEIGDELGDELYLNPGGCNRMFILLTTEQRTAPLLNARFSTSRDILKRFIAENEEQLFALTARDAVAGELDNSVFDVSKPARLFDIRRITIEADTTGQHLRTSAELMTRIKRFQAEDDAWWDDVLISDMIGLAKKTGDVTRNPIALARKDFEQGNFWTAHFGGLYVFRDLDHPAAISVGDRSKLGDLPIAKAYDFTDRNEIAKFLELNGLAQSLIDKKLARAARLIEEKLDFMLAEAATAAGEDVTGRTGAALRKAARRHLDALPEAFHQLNALVRWARGDGDWPRITSRDAAYFYTLRAAQGPNRDLVNMLLADLCPLDFRQLFICHKEAFYTAYRGWTEPKKDYVADYLGRAYIADKAGVRDALFGPFAEPAPGPWERPARGNDRRRRDDDDDDDLVARVGPWGAIRGRD